MEAVKFLREQTKQPTSEKKIRIQRAGCLDLCSKGPVLVVYPEGCFYHFDNKEDLKKIAQQHLLEGKKVESLLLPDEV